MAMGVKEIVALAESLAVLAMRAIVCAPDSGDGATYAAEVAGVPATGLKVPTVGGFKLQFTEMGRPLESVASKVAA
jgi:hypothetical protein